MWQNYDTNHYYKNSSYDFTHEDDVMYVPANYKGLKSVITEFNPLFNLSFYGLKFNISLDKNTDRYDTI